MEKYYLHLDGEQKGPYTIGQLQAMWLAGTIDRNTQFYTKANGDWKKLEAMIERLEPSPPTTPPTAAMAAPGPTLSPQDAASSRPAAGRSPEPSAPPAATAAVSATPAGAERCVVCGGLSAHLSGCPLVGEKAQSAVGAATPVAPTPQQWRDRMPATAQSQASVSETGRMVHEGFPMLNFFSSLIRGLGWLAFLIGAMLTIAALAAIGGHGAVAALGLLPALGLAVAGIVLIVIGEIIGVVFSIEKNTFKAAASLDLIARHLRARNVRQKK